jgi:hypothetical protein
MEFVEKDCVFEHGGRKFESGGAVACHGLVTGYVKMTPHGLGLFSWHGDFLFVILRQTSSWRIRSVWGTHMRSYEAWIDGRKWIGRGVGEEMVLHLRPSGHAS